MSWIRENIKPKDGWHKSKLNDVPPFIVPQYGWSAGESISTFRKMYRTPRITPLPVHLQTGLEVSDGVKEFLAYLLAVFCRAVMGVANALRELSEGMLAAFSSEGLKFNRPNRA
uniref:Uncharacterized protein n=1 Tax=Anopheles culicifacies TaxID=139723 RepID=A0A182LYD9_9DIPT